MCSRPVLNVHKCFILCLSSGIIYLNIDNAVHIQNKTHTSHHKIILLPKPPGIPLLYRPICLFDTRGKILEYIFQNSLIQFTEGIGGLSTNQFGFGWARSIIGAVKSVTGESLRTLGARAANQILCAVIELENKIGN